MAGPRPMSRIYKNNTENLKKKTENMHITITKFKSASSKLSTIEHLRF